MTLGKVLVQDAHVNIEVCAACGSPMCRIKLFAHPKFCVLSRIFVALPLYCFGKGVVSVSCLVCPLCASYSLTWLAGEKVLHPQRGVTHVDGILIHRVTIQACIARILLAAREGSLPAFEDQLSAARSAVMNPLSAASMQSGVY